MQQKYLRKRLAADVTAFEKTALVQLIEEATEVIHAAAKTLRWGFDSCHPDRPAEGSNADRLDDEIHDFNAAVDRLRDARTEASHGR